MAINPRFSTAALVYCWCYTAYQVIASPLYATSHLDQSKPYKRNTASWTGLGCWSDDRYNRSLQASATLEDVTVENCQAECYTTGYSLAGVEYGDECWCDNGIQDPAAKIDESHCNFHCSGNAKEGCGGDLAIDIYSYNSASPSPTTSSTTPTHTPITMPGTYVSRGCFTDSISTRTLEVVGNFLGASQGMAIQPCQDACRHAGYEIAGLEFGKECWCDSAVRAGASMVASYECNMPCSGNATEICGGKNRINLYAFIAGPVNSTSTPVIAKSTARSSDSSAVPSSTPICSMYYKVASGDICYDIWTRFRISQPQFAAWNPTLFWPNPVIYPGQMLCVQQGT